MVVHRRLFKKASTLVVLEWGIGLCNCKFAIDNVPYDYHSQFSSFVTIMSAERALKAKDKGNKCFKDGQLEE